MHYIKTALLLRLADVGWVGSGVDLYLETSWMSWTALASLTKRLKVAWTALGEKGRSIARNRQRQQWDMATRWGQ